MRISVIIPVYNSKNYLRKCLNSLKRQSYKDLEIILVNDGSTDNSLNICNEFKKNDKRFKVYTKKNGGTSSARNYGIKKATGDYITFVDNDDFINDKKCFEKIVKYLEENGCDVLLHNCIYYWEKQNKYNYPKTNYDRNKIINNKNDALKYLIKNNIFTYTVWDKVIKREIIINNNLYFSEGKRNEDSEFCIKLLENSNTFDYYNEPFYVYRKEHSYAQTSILKYKENLDLKELIINSVNYYDREKDIYIYNFISYLYAVYLGQASIIKNDNVINDLKEMKKYKYLFNYNLNKYMKYVSLCYKLLGFNLTVKLLGMYIKNKYNLKENK